MDDAHEDGLVILLLALLQWVHLTAFIFSSTSHWMVFFVWGLVAEESLQEKMRPGLQQNKYQHTSLLEGGGKNHFEQSQLESMPQVFLKLGIQSLLTLTIQNAWLPDHSKSWVRTWQLNHQGPVREWRRFCTIQLSETFFRLEDGE